MRRSLLLLLSLGTVQACSASTSAAPSTRPAVQTIGGADAGRTTLVATSAADVSQLSYAADAVWRVLPSVFDSLAIPLSTVDQARKEIGNTGLKVRRRLGNVPLSRYLDCGNTQMDPNADNYDIVLTVLSRVTPNGVTAATLTTTVEAQARPATYSQAYSRCSSKGGLELRLADLVKARLGR